MKRAYFKISIIAFFLSIFFHTQLSTIEKVASFNGGYGMAQCQDEMKKKKKGYFKILLNFNPITSICVCF